jgi:hypothetical protein
MRKALCLCALPFLFVIQAQAKGSCAAPEACRLLQQSEAHVLSLSPQQLAALEADFRLSQDQTATKAISRKDLTDASITGPVVLVGDLTFLDDGEPFRVLILQTHTWMNQLVPLICLDNLASTCGTLHANQRIATTSNIFAFQDGEFEALSLFYVRVLRTR